jgi:hypothetical protein
MSRINIQTGLSGSPNLPTGLGSVNPGSFTPVVDTTAGDVLNLVRGAIGVATQVNQQNVQQRETKIAEDYEMSSANLIRLREQAERDPSRQTAFLRAFDAADQKFAGTRFEAEVVGLGEGVKTQFEQRNQMKRQKVAESFVNLQVLPAALEFMSQPENRESLMAIEDYSDRLDEVNRMLVSMVPDNAAETMTPETWEGLQMNALEINNRLQRDVEAQAEEDEKRSDRLVANNAEVELSRNNIPYSRYLADMEAAGVDPIQAGVRAADALSKSLDAAFIAGDREGMHSASVAAWEALQVTQDPTAKRMLAATVAASESARASLDTDTLGQVWSEVAATRGIAAANIETELAARDMLSLEYFQEAYTVPDISLLPETGFKGEYKKGIVAALNKFTQKVPTEDPKIVGYADQVFSTSESPDASPSELIKMDVSEWSQMAATLVSQTSLASDLFPEGSSGRSIGGYNVTTPEEYEAVLALAATDLPLRAAVIADRFAETRFAGELLRGMASVGSDYLTSQDGIDQVSAVLGEIGVENLQNHIPDVNMRYALGRFHRSEDKSVETFQSFLSEAQQFRGKINSKTTDATLSEFVGSPEFAQALTGVKRFGNRPSRSFALDEETKQKILISTPLEFLDNNTTPSPELVAAKTKEFMDKTGRYLHFEKATVPGARDRFSILTSTAVPEAHGFATTDVEESLNMGVDVPASRYITNVMSGGNETDIWAHAASFYNNPNAAERFSRDALIEMHRRGDAEIRILSSQADQSSVPVVLIVRQAGSLEPLRRQIGALDFSQMSRLKEVSGRVFNEGGKKTEAPSRRTGFDRFQP